MVTGVHGIAPAQPPRAERQFTPGGDKDGLDCGDAGPDAAAAEYVTRGSPSPICQCDLLVCGPPVCAPAGPILATAFEPGNGGLR
jgi:hypothetical protein